MHKTWESNIFGIEPSGKGVARIEIDESKIIGNSDKIIWMFGMIDRVDKEARIYCVKEDRTQEILLNIVKNNAYTFNDNLDDETTFNTRIYSDCLARYQPLAFKNAGYKLHRFNDSVWFGSGLFHTNSIEGLWSQLKRLIKDFSGLTIDKLSKLEAKGVDIKDYLNSWIYFRLYLSTYRKI